MAFKVPGKSQKSGILFANVIENADCALAFRCKSQNLPPGTSELPLNGFHLFDRDAKVGLEKLFQDIHECGWQLSRGHC